ncbi:MAG TPA: DUF2062 domain-containing protein [Geminicoccaceae bacterium]|nr:DUF2062 domain-containing protein [Geminicoccus sp.]HMU48239.1 DUF2062 domain-containing protein [Geminicoccaceae bacterium]
MVMARREARPLLARLRNLVWPAIGWRRTGRYLMMRLHRLSGTPHSIALGLACGISVSFLPLVGFHILGALALCWLCRGNLVAAAIGTLAGNPWTLPLMFAGDYRLGSLLIGTPAVELGAGSLHSMLDGLWHLFWPTLVGSVPLAVLSALGSYSLSRPLIARVQQRRRRRIAAAEMLDTGPVAVDGHVINQ